MFINLYIARPIYYFILMYTCGLTVVIKRICYVKLMLCLQPCLLCASRSSQRFTEPSRPTAWPLYTFLGPELAYSFHEVCLAQFSQENATY